MLCLSIVGSKAQNEYNPKELYLNVARFLDTPQLNSELVRIRNLITMNE